MKRLIDFIMSKDRENDLTISAQKSDPKAKKIQISQESDKGSGEPNELFWDDYSDIGYC